jgi:lysophospholipase L1-like esterase
MSSSRTPLRRIAAAAVLIGAVAACEQKALVSLPRTAVNHTLFASYVALGNSITAGYQSGGILDTTQAESYAAILAHQAGTRYAYAALAFPGCPPPIVNFQTQARLGGVGSTSTSCSLRDPSSVTAILNNVAVPGAASNDPTSYSDSNSNALTTFILGGKTQVQRALEADPTFVSIWIGNNDVLPQALSGFALGQPTPTDTFNARYDLMMQQLTTGQKGLKGILIGVVDVTQIPALFPVDSLINDPVFDAEFNAAVTGNPADVVPIAGDCVGAHALVSIEIIAALQAAEVPGIGCATADPFTLDTIKQGIVSQSVAAYNAHISADAASAGFAYIDPNALLAALKAEGAIAPIPNFLSATSPFGAFITLDGIHPSALTHQYFANALIATINAKYGVAIDTVAHE